MEFIEVGASWLLGGVPSLRQLVQLPLLLNPISSPDSSSQSSLQQTCPHPSLSCPSSVPFPIDTCCVNHPSGHFLLAQFWDTFPPTGPNNSWTLHGLWPDYCTGGFPQNCEPARELDVEALVAIVDDASKSTHPGLRSYMDEYWKGLSGDESLWMHEWNKHGTCVSTLVPSCYDDNAMTPASHSTPNSRYMQSHLDLLDYFTAATTLHSTLQTHDVLAAHNIVPSNSQTYSLRDIQAALASVHDNHISTVKCNRRGEINEIWMHFTVDGPLRSFTSDPSSAKIFVPVVPDGLITTCPQEGIKYLPKLSHEKPNPPPSRTSHVPGPTSPPFNGRGYLKVHVLDDDIDDASIEKEAPWPQDEHEGCLISRGYWYTSGTCAIYRTQSDDSKDSGLFTLSSSAGACTILENDGWHGSSGEFVCDKKLDGRGAFSRGKTDGDNDSDVLTWNGQSVFYADRRPGKFQRVRVFADDGDGDRPVKLEIRWEGR